ncbi:MAG: hypothetical protein OEN55_01220 [Alphaproteobacteria bacterium]|nr:hypothetical protein [Alphaproteobacteria bacterium]
MAARRGIGRSARLLALGPLFYLWRAPGTAIMLCLLVLILTILTQVGGLLLWLGLPVLDLLGRTMPGSRILRLLAAAGVFVPAYLAVSIVMIPPLAAQFGRVPLPCGPRNETAYGALTVVTCLLNRHYATAAARDVLAATAKRWAADFPDGRLSFLDSGFPFFAWFPMLPHLSHGDGRKVDVALLFLDPATGGPASGRAPSPIGYWGYVKPEVGATLPCGGRSTWLRWDFDWLQPLLPELRLDEAAVAALLQDLAASPRVVRIFVEPHISARLGVKNRKIRFQGCAAARHDDHIHVEFR